MKRISKYISEKLYHQEIYEKLYHQEIDEKLYHQEIDEKLIVNNTIQKNIDDMSIEEFMKQYGCEINKERQAKAIADSEFNYSKYDKVFHKSNIFIKIFEKIYDNSGDIEDRINKDLKDILGECYVTLKKYATYGHMTIFISKGERMTLYCHLSIENNIWLTHYNISFYNFNIDITTYDNIMKHIIEYLINRYGG